VNWVRQQKRNHRPSHIALYDLQSGCCLEEIETEPHGIGVVFTLFQTFPSPSANASAREK